MPSLGFFASTFNTNEAGSDPPANEDVSLSKSIAEKSFNFDLSETETPTI